MKTQVTLTIDKEIKDKFQEIAKKMGANMSTLANMYFTQVVNT
jgi:antitoxin component of RelBE/YafQ-DinJ toxin-antitoxin module